MKENENENDQNDICFSDNNQTEQLDISSNYINIYREILNSREYLKINFNNNFDNININLSSYLSIIQMLQEYPESYIKFIFKEEKFFASNKVLNFSNSNSSIHNIKEDDSNYLQSSNKKILEEELIDTDIMKSNTFAGKNNNFLNLNNEENNDNNNNNKKEEEEIMTNNIKKMQLFSTNQNIDANININTNIDTNTNINTKINNKKSILKTKNAKNMNKTTVDKKLVLFKWIYHFYIILSIIILIHYLTYIFSVYNYTNFYKITSLSLIICLALVGYIEIKYKYNQVPYFIFRGKYLFWIHFLILILTILSFSGFLLTGGKFKFINSQGIFGYIIALIYIIALFIQSYYCLYYDVIIEEINRDINNNNNNKMNDFIDNNLNIQLTEIN